jgi:hypothetical protein
LAFAVDAAGYRGETDTFFYYIDLPPSPQFSFQPDTANVQTPVTFDAGLTIDQESPHAKLVFKWDFNGDGVWEETKLGKTNATFSFPIAGRYPVVLEVVDTTGKSIRISKELFIKDFCPASMAFVSMQNGRSFCIDIYEAPNAKGKPPKTSATWIQASTNCLDAGKRLCTAEEWQYACNGGSNRVYPYGTVYAREKCATEGNSPFKSGQFNQCGEGFELRDMVGNVWEWVADRKSTNATLMGGSYHYGKDAHCGLSSSGNITTSAEDIGYRCCR